MEKMTTKEKLQIAMRVNNINNLRCDFQIEHHSHVLNMIGVRPLDAYMETIHTGDENAKCFACPNGIKSRKPIFEMVHGRAYLSGKAV